MENENFDTSNINFKWLENIYEQLRDIQEMEKLAKEGCLSLLEYINIPYEMRGLLLPEIQYKNLRFAILELNILIDNLQPILKEKTIKYKKDIESVINAIDKRDLFIKEQKRNNTIYKIELLPFFNFNVKYIFDIKSKIISDIGFLLYIENKEKNKPWQ